MIGIELGDEVPQFRPIRLQGADALLALFEQGDVLAPGEQTVWSREGQPCEDKQDSERAETRELFSHRFAPGHGRVHERTESQLTQ